MDLLSPASIGTQATKIYPKLIRRLRRAISPISQTPLAPAPPFQASWREELLNLASPLSSGDQYRLLMSALVYDVPAWLLLRRRPLLSSHLLIIGGGWGRQLELLLPYYRQITVFEPDHNRRAFLHHRFAQHPNAPQFLENLDGFPAPVDLILIRHTSLDNFPHRLLISPLKELRRRCPQADFFIETASHISLARWRFFLRSQLGLHQELYAVDGEHWMAHRYRFISKVDNVLQPIIPYRPGWLSRAPRALQPKHVLLIGRSSPQDTSEGPSFRIAGRGFLMPLPITHDPVIRIPLTPNGINRCQRAHQSLHNLHQDETLPPEIRRVLPRSQETTTDDGLPAFSETLMPGQAGPRALDDDKTHQIIRWLAALHNHTQQAANGPDSQAGKILIERVEQLTTLGDTIVNKLGSSEHKTLWLAIRDALRQIPWEDGPVLTSTHGDFHPGNILFYADEISGVIDWETSYLAAIPARDLFWFLISREIKTQSAAAPMYRALFLKSAPPPLLSFYQRLVDPALADFVWHPWCRLAYPLERLQSAWDGYDLDGVINRGSFAVDFLNLLPQLSAFLESYPSIRRSTL